MNKKCFVIIASISLLFLAFAGCHSRSSSSRYEASSNLSESEIVTLQGQYTKQAALQSSRWLARDFSPEKELLKSIRDSLANQKNIETIPELNIGFNPSLSYVCVTIFERGNRPIRWISKRKTLLKTLNRITFKLRGNRSFEQFNVADANRCRIMLEVVTGEQPLDINKFASSQLGENRYEPGITGFKLKYNNKTYYYMPTDAVVYSHLTVKHALNHISKKVGVAKKTNKISERLRLVKSLPAKWSTMAGVAFVTFGEDIIPLFRGYPGSIEFSKQMVFDTAKESVDWIWRNMDSEGKFLYYYDGVKDTVIDHAHPTRTLENNYYNSLRHNGGVIALLKMYELSNDRKYLVAAEKALDFLILQLRSHQYRNKKAYYVYFNSKGKLGGSGTALAAFMRYYEATGESKYNKYIYGLAWHLLSRVDEDGEMIGYYIHPSYNDAHPILEPSAQEKKELFSFYYPGEALLGLALFEQQMQLSDIEREEVRHRAMKALDFLVNIRPRKYADMFKSLPSDGWLMQAIEQWSYDRQFQKKEYLNFVFNDARQMISHMYTRANSPYYDYPGTFYYNYGDHAYPDGARGEGLIASYYLAKRMGEDRLADYLLDGCKMVAGSLLRTYNSQESTFMHRFPEKSIGSFRFKFTRQWVRVDSVQHTACFYLRLFPELEE